MNKNNYPKTYGHMKEHQDLLNEVSYLKIKFMKGGGLVVLQSLNDWFILHILNFDKPFANYLVTQGIN
jgi:hemerythrin